MNLHELGVSAGDEQQQIGKCQPVGQARRQGMALEMVDGMIGDAGCRRQRLGGHHAGQQSADQTGSCRYGDSVDIGPIASGLIHRLLDQPVKARQMRAGGDFRHDAAKGCVICDLGMDATGQDASSIVGALHHRCRRFVATGFDPQYKHEIPFRICEALASSLSPKP